MLIDCLPAWDHRGYLPAVLPGKEGHSPHRSPYTITSVGLVKRFGTRPERLEILKGFFEYRKGLHSLGLNQGMQWLDGSFVENIEVLGNRPPKDIDVVTFPLLPEGKTQQSFYAISPNAFTQSEVKQRYKVDAYYVFLGLRSNEFFVKQVAYWHGMWSRTRNNSWKGFVQLSLDASEDQAAVGLIASLLEDDNE